MLIPQDDIDKIMAVMDDAFDPAFGEAWTRRQVEGALVMGNCHYRLIAATGMEPVEGEAAVGFAMVRHILDEAELLLFAVNRAWRGRGLGATLLRDVMQHTRNLGVTRMMLEMRDGNPAQRLYMAQGFASIGRRPKYYRQPNGESIDAITLAAPVE